MRKNIMPMNIVVRHNLICSAALLAAICGIAAVNAHAAEASAMYEQKIRPLLASQCFDCHSAKADEVKGALKLDSLEDILKGGANGPAIQPGDVENSFLLRAIRYQEDDYQMPPRGRLSDEDISLFEEWVKSLAPARSSRK